MNVITMSETAVETIEAPEASAVDIEVANGVTYLLPDTKQVPLSKLIPSPANVRRVNAAVNISELADSIEAHGLIQNLTVRKAKRGNKYEVVAGARRFAALLLLAKEGRIDPSADFTKLGQRIQYVAAKRFAKSRPTEEIDFRLPCFSQE